MRLPLVILGLIGAVAVSGCVQKELRDIRATGTGPDEFLVLPPKPLTEPADYSALPAPTPGGSNLTDANPQAEAIAALGGKPAAAEPTGAIPSGDAGLVTASSRYGVAANVRQTLAAEDAKFLKRKRRGGKIKIAPVDRYEQIYSKQTLDPFAVNAAFRRAGVATPSAPPRNED
ncbi:hypothetical protein PH5382_00699 [Phaeobacter sp. CECT 5382]|uniref:DUF3035 domain-containing protein n=1 Tax=Phaeobacter sp. CECT 5382 TaxID=1712645 RepID=UPI0006DB894A|nr:DUF3035 domain-containing protein [Phaeobacter sp. CECT 5382]CUH86786.1 hypothetical protein PH5382_00699 [Phaeobacter sp. CECT 5382]